MTNTCKIQFLHFFFIAIVSLAIAFGPRVSPPTDRPIKKALRTQPGLIGEEMRKFSVCRVDEQKIMTVVS